MGALVSPWGSGFRRSQRLSMQFTSLPFLVFLVIVVTVLSAKDLAKFALDLKLDEVLSLYVKPAAREWADF